MGNTVAQTRVMVNDTCLNKHTLLMPIAGFKEIYKATAISDISLMCIR